MEPHSAKRQKNSVDYENVILALPAEFPSPSKKKRPHTPGKKRATRSKKTSTGSYLSNASMWASIPWKLCREIEW
jgi:hypothetical protein